MIRVSHDEGWIYVTLVNINYMSHEIMGGVVLSTSLAHALFTAYFVALKSSWSPALVINKTLFSRVNTLPEAKLFTSFG